VWSVQNWGLPLNLTPKEGQIFTQAPYGGPPGGQIYAHAAMPLCHFGRTLDPLSNSPYHIYPPLAHFVHGVVEYCEFCWISSFQGDLTQKWCNVLGMWYKILIRRIVLYDFGKYFGDRPPSFGVIQLQTWALRENGHFCKMSRFYGALTQKWCNASGTWCKCLIQNITLYNRYKNFRGGPSLFGVIEIQTCLIVMFSRR